MAAVDDNEWTDLHYAAALDWGALAQGAAGGLGRRATDDAGAASFPDARGRRRRAGPTPGAPCPGDSEPRRLPHASAVPRASGLSNEPAGVPSPPSPEEPIAQRVLRQARTGQLDEDRLLPGKDKRERDPTKKLDKLAAQAGWYTFVSTKRTRSPRGRPPARRNAEWWCRR